MEGGAEGARPLTLGLLSSPQATTAGTAPRSLPISQHWSLSHRASLSISLAKLCRRRLWPLPWDTSGAQGV